jgi:predicted CDP-diglyceride synthetase/phosphatidate cytidylyltransferase
MASSTLSITIALAVALLATVIVAFAVASRGGRFRGFPGWSGFQAFFVPLLVLLARADPRISLTVLGLCMFVGLREFFFLAPLRPRDRWALLLAYVSIPIVLWPELRGPATLFLVAAPVVLFLVLPALLAVGTPQGGTFEASGRLITGLIVFVFCAGHLGLIAKLNTGGAIQLYGLLVLVAELPQRLAGRVRAGEGVVRAWAGIATGAALAAWVGALAAPLGGFAPRQGSILGLLVAAGAAAGAFIAEASAQELNLGAPAARVGRKALFDRTMPALFAAPFFFHYAFRSLGLP